MTHYRILLVIFTTLFFGSCASPDQVDTRLNRMIFTVEEDGHEYVCNWKGGIVHKANCKGDGK